MKKPCNGCEFSIQCRTPKTIKNNPGLNCRECEKYSKYIKYRDSKKKYIKSDKIYTMAEFEKHISDEFMYWGDSIRHIGWLCSLQYRVLDNAVKRGMIFTAIKKSDN